MKGSHFLKNWKLYLSLIFTYIVMQVGSVFLTKPIFHYLMSRGAEPSKQLQFTAFSWSLALTSSLAVILFLLIKRYFTKEFLDDFEGVRASLKETILWGVAGFLFALIGQIVMGLIETYVLGIEQGSANTEQLTMMANASPVMIISIVLCAPILEEFIFRRVFFAGFAKKMPLLLAAILSASMFSLVHGEPSHFLLYATPGLIFAFIYIIIDIL